MIVGAATRRVHSDICSATTRLPALSDTLMWCGLQQPHRKIIQSFFSRSVLDFYHYINELLFAYLLNVLSLLGSYSRTCPVFAFN